jgi:hypothetical protein
MTILSPVDRDEIFACNGNWAETQPGLKTLHVISPLTLETHFLTRILSYYELSVTFLWPSSGITMIRSLF